MSKRSAKEIANERTLFFCVRLISSSMSLIFSRIPIATDVFGASRRGLTGAASERGVEERAKTFVEPRGLFVATDTTSY